MCSLLGIGFPLSNALGSCQKDGSTFEGKIIIIGAGAAGLTAGHLLSQMGVEFELLEASSQYGGRMKTSTDFVDFPIPLGAEWLHVETDVFSELVNDSSVNISTETKGYDLENDFGFREQERISVEEAGFGIDRKFVNATWLSFFEAYIVPSLSGRITYNAVVQSINYSNDSITVKTQDQEYQADKVLLTVPLKMLQKGAIEFSPQLPNNKQNAIDEATVWDGFKAFIQFSEKFYPAFTDFVITPEEAGQKLYYDAAYGQKSNQHVLGLFSVGTGAQPYLDLNATELKDYMLSELDALYEGAASQYYLKHTFQNWNKEPYIEGAYCYDYEKWTRVRTLGNDVDKKLFFAGEAYTNGMDWGSVHAAGRAAAKMVEEMVK